MWLYMAEKIREIYYLLYYRFQIISLNDFLSKIPKKKKIQR